MIFGDRLTAKDRSAILMEDECACSPCTLTFIQDKGLLFKLLNPDPSLDSHIEPTKATRASTNASAAG